MRWSMTAAILLAMAGAVRAEESVSLKEKKYRADQMGYMKEPVDSTNEKCGTKVTLDIAFAGFTKAEPDHGTHSVYGNCEAPLDAMRMLCDDAVGKEAVQKNIKKIACSYGGPGKRSVTLKDGTLTWVVDWDGSNNSDFVKAYLENNM